MVENISFLLLFFISLNKPTCPESLYNKLLKLYKIVSFTNKAKLLFIFTPESEFLTAKW